MIHTCITWILLKLSHNWTDFYITGKHFNAKQKIIFQSSRLEFYDNEYKITQGWAFLNSSWIVTFQNYLMPQNHQFQIWEMSQCTKIMITKWKQSQLMTVKYKTFLPEYNTGRIRTTCKNKLDKWNIFQHKSRNIYSLFLHYIHINHTTLHYAISVPPNHL